MVTVIAVINLVSLANKHLKIIPDDDIAKANLAKVNRKMSRYYQYHIICLFKELLSILATPVYYMIILHMDAEKICNCIVNNMKKHYIMGNVSRYSIFTDYSSDIAERNPKLKYSIETFQQEHSDWRPEYNEFDIPPSHLTDNKLDLPDTSLLEIITTQCDGDSDSSY